MIKAYNVAVEGTAEGSTSRLEGRRSRVRVADGKSLDRDLVGNFKVTRWSLGEAKL